MTTYTNTDVQTRTWGRITNPDTNRSLVLGPGEEVDLDLSEDFHDPYLKPVTGKPTRKSSIHRHHPAADVPDGATEPDQADAAAAEKE